MEMRIERLFCTIITLFFYDSIGQKTFQQLLLLFCSNAECSQQLSEWNLEVSVDLNTLRLNCDRYICDKTDCQIEYFSSSVLVVVVFKKARKRKESM